MITRAGIQELYEDYEQRRVRNYQMSIQAEETSDQFLNKGRWSEWIGVLYGLRRLMMHHPENDDQMRRYLEYEMKELGERIEELVVMSSQEDITNRRFWRLQGKIDTAITAYEKYVELLVAADKELLDAWEKEVLQGVREALSSVWEEKERYAS